MKSTIYSAITSKLISATTSLCNLMLAWYFPNLFTEPPTTFINFLSMSVPALANASARLILLTDPNNLSPDPTFDEILISYPLIVVACLLASSTNLASLKARCFKFSANTFFAEEVAKIACPVGIKKFLP